jgi:enoyl-CoA hydratase/carnithine racemase
MKNPILERSNVGMGMLLTNSKTCNLEFINMFYRKLRDLEVNTLKRFTAVTASDRSLLVGPIGLRHLLLLSEAGEPGIDILIESLRNQADLALVVSDYFKPLVTLMNASDSGIALAALANTSGCFKDSVFQFNLVKYGYVPTGGLSFVLAQTPWSIGEFLALTSRTLRAQDILFCRLVKRWISPEAFGFMEVTSEHKLGVSEKDANLLLEEHFLSPPMDWSLKPFINTIQEAFGNDHFEDVVKALQRSASSSDVKISAFAAECLDRMNQSDPLALRLTFKLIKRTRKHLADVKSGIQIEQGEETLNFMERRSRIRQEHILKPAMIESLKDEIRVASRLVPMDSFKASLHAFIVGQERPLSELKMSAGEFETFFDPIERDYMYSERSDFPLSAHPKLRKFHPDFNPQTGLDHDPQFMARETQRWSREYLKTKTDQVRRAVTGLSELNNSNISWD